MLAYALFIAFVSAFIAIAATGHVMLLMAIYPNLFGTPKRHLAAAEAEFAPSQQGQPESPKLAA